MQNRSHIRTVAKRVLHNPTGLANIEEVESLFLSLPLETMSCIINKHNSFPTKKDIHHHQQPLISNHKNPSTSSDIDNRNPNPNNLVNRVMESVSVSAKDPLIIDGADQDSMLQKSKFLTREEVLRRRLRRIRQVKKLYRDHYWGLMEELRVKYRDYYWEYGKSPYEEERENVDVPPPTTEVVEGSGENHNNNKQLGLGNGENGNNDGKYKKCGFLGCKTKAMALTSYCYQHILSDSKQTLYKPCNYVTKSANTVTVHCGKPILRSNAYSLCSVHLPKAERHVTQALRKAGLNITSTSKLAPKFHLIVAESVRQINAKRRERKVAIGKPLVKEETVA